MYNIRLLFGKGVPSSSVSGIERAAAKETTPRIPDHPMMKGAFRFILGSATVMKLLITLVTMTAPYEAKRRTTISTIVTKTP